MLNSLFQQYPGFREVRLIPIKNVAFIEYEEEYQAGLALSGLSLRILEIKFKFHPCRFDRNEIGREHHTVELCQTIILENSFKKIKEIKYFLNEQ